MVASSAVSVAVKVSSRETVPSSISTAAAGKIRAIHIAAIINIQNIFFIVCYLTIIVCLNVSFNTVLSIFSYVQKPNATEYPCV